MRTGRSRSVVACCGQPPRAQKLDGTELPMAAYQWHDAAASLGECMTGALTLMRLGIVRTQR